MFLAEHKLLLISFFLLITHLVHSQTSLSYNGPYRVADYSGIADYKFKFLDGDTVINGPFLIKSANLNDLISSKDKRFTISGRFLDGKPSGPWQFGFEELSLAEGQIEVVNNEYRLKVNGVRHKASGSIVNGNYQGKWIHEVQELNNSEASNTSFKSAIEFDQGIPQRSFRIENELMILAGRFLRNGLAHDQWELYSLNDTEASEKWLFDNGVLKEIKWSRGDSSQVCPFFNKSWLQTDTIALGTQYLKVLELHSILNDSSALFMESSIADLLNQNAQYYQKVDQILTSLGNNDFTPEFKVKILNNQLNNNELEHITFIKNSYNQSSLIATRLLESTQVNLLKLTDENVLFLSEVTGLMNQRHIKLLSKVNSYYEIDALSHVDRELLLPRLWTNTADYKDLTVNYTFNKKLNSQSYQNKHSNDYKFGLKGLAGLKEFAAFTLNTITNIQTEINSKLNADQRAQELVEIEEGIINQVNEFNSLIDSLSAERDPRTTEILNDIRSSATQEVANYTKIDDISTKLLQADSLNQCLADMKILAHKSALKKERDNQIQQTYTDRVWNPFTSTLMDEQVKKRITEGYFTYLQPAIWQEVNSELSCSNVDATNKRIDALYEAMMVLRDKETDKLERKLKRVRDPEAISQLLLESAINEYNP